MNLLNFFVRSIRKLPFTKMDCLIKTVSVIARAVVDFSLVESPGKNVGYTDVGGDCPIFYMSNEMFVELYNNPAIMSYVFDVEKEHFFASDRVHQFFAYR